MFCGRAGRTAGANCWITIRFPAPHKATTISGTCRSAKFMALGAGALLGPFEILAPLGAGGMGEVYRARDTKLGRDVALKILPELFASDSDRLARFQREAQVLASLNHPNIAIIPGLEKSDGVTGSFMELVEGPTLADLIAKCA